MRAGRALLGIDQQTLAERAGVSLPTIQRMEASTGNVRGVVDTLTKVVAAFEAAGEYTQQRPRTRRPLQGTPVAQGSAITSATAAPEERRGLSTSTFQRR